VILPGVIQVRAQVFACSNVRLQTLRAFDTYTAREHAEDRRRSVEVDPDSRVLYGPQQIVSCAERVFVEVCRAKLHERDTVLQPQAAGGNAIWIQREALQ
jgi:hypothetical protein